MNFVIGIIVVVIAIIAAYFGAFDNMHYTNKYLRRYATPVKLHLEKIKKMEDATKIETVISLYNGISEGIDAIESHYRISDVKGDQVCCEAENRYIQIHGFSLDYYQRKALNRTLDYSEFYSLCLINAMKCYCDNMKEQIDKLKTEPAKERRREKVIEAIKICSNEIKERGKGEYLAPLIVYGKMFNIEVVYKIPFLE